MDVEAAALLLAETYKELKFKGKFKAASTQVLAHVVAQLELPPDLIKWYSVAAPETVKIPAIHKNCLLLDYRKLEDALAGYAYNTRTGQKLTNWNNNWIIIAGENKYPVLIHSAKIADPKIYCAKFSAKKWQLITLSQNLTGFLHGIICYIQLYHSYKQRITDSNDKLYSEFANDFENLLNSHPATIGTYQVWLSDLLGYWM
jgi:hypothetical protein